MAHPDFRVKGGKIFATLGYPDERFSVLILTADQQGELVGRDPKIFELVKGGWGKRGSTQVVLEVANPGRDRIGHEDGLGQRSAYKSKKEKLRINMGIRSDM